MKYTVVCRLETARDYYIILTESLNRDEIEESVRERVGWENGSIDIVAAFEGKHVPFIYEGYGSID